MNRFASVALSMFVGASIAAVAQPKLEIVGGDTYDWGKTKAPTSGHLEAEVKMKNVGTGTLKLVEIRPGCGCTKTDPDKTELGPGEVSTMKVKLNISPSQSGALTKSITIRSAPLEPGKPGDTATAYYFLKADIVRALQIAPTVFFSFNDLKIGQEASSKLTITNNDNADMVLSDFKTDNGIVLNTTGKTTLKPGEKFDLIAKIVPQAKGSFTGTVSFHTNHPDHASVEIKAYGMVVEQQSPVFQKNEKN